MEVAVSKKRYNFETKKSVHVNLMLGTHAGFRSKLLSKGISMQAALEECAIRIAQGDSYMEKLLDDVVDKKINGELQIAAQEADSLYRLIEKGVDNDDIERE